MYTGVFLSTHTHTHTHAHTHTHPTPYSLTSTEQQQHCLLLLTTAAVSQRETGRKTRTQRWGLLAMIFYLYRQCACITRTHAVVRLHTLTLSLTHIHTD